jgi:hypothetical protein
MGAALALLGLLATGCDRVPDDPRVPSLTPAADPVPVILVPGAEASTLVSGDGRVMWAAAIGDLLDPATFDRLAQPLSPGIDAAEPFVPTDIVRGVPGQDFYGGLIKSLERRSGGPCVLPPAVRALVLERADGPVRLAKLEAWFVQALERGRRLQLALGQPVPAPFAYDIFAGDCMPTLARLVEEHIDGAPRLRFSPAEIEHPRPGVDYSALMYHPGDGWVTRGSALGRDIGRRQPAFEVRNAVLGCAGHSQVPSVSAVRNTLMGVLALADADAPDPGAGVRYALREQAR